MIPVIRSCRLDLSSEAPDSPPSSKCFRQQVSALRGLALDKGFTGFSLASRELKARSEVMLGRIDGAAQRLRDRHPHGWLSLPQTQPGAQARMGQCNVLCRRTGLSRRRTQEQHEQ